MPAASRRELPLAALSGRCYAQRESPPQIYLEHATVRDYYFEEEVTPAGERVFSLVGGEQTPFPGVILTELSEEEALFYRDVHVDLRRAFAQDERVQLLAARLALTDGQRNQVIALIAKLNGTR